MSKLYVFGIGGTGSRVLRSLTMMLAAGVKTSQSDVVPIVIDPDSANADLTRTVALMNKYANLRQHLTFPEKGQGTFFKAKIDQILPVPAIHRTACHEQAEPGDDADAFLREEPCFQHERWFQG